MLELNKVSAGYGRKTVLEDISAAFPKGKLTSIIGVNGCGKTTLLKTVLGMLPVGSGEIRMDGVLLSNLTRNEIAKKAAYLAQGKSTPDMTVEQMVLHGRFPHLQYPRRYTEQDREIACAAMERVGIEALAEQPMSTLSGGMRQNAYIAMALAQSTDYILLDEPTTYLDISHQLELMKTLRELADGGKGIIAVMHDLPMAFHFSDEIVLIHRGKIQTVATPEDLWDSDEIREIFGVRLSKNECGQFCYQYGAASHRSCANP